jgi:hypothetical protein
MEKAGLADLLAHIRPMLKLPCKGITSLDFVVDAFSPEVPPFWRRASTFCKALLKKSTPKVFSASSRLSWLTSLRSVDSRGFSGGGSALMSTGSS